MNRALLSSKSMTWATPLAVFNDLNRLLRFTLDGCSAAETSKCRRFVSDDGLNHPWSGETVFQNPPYGRAIGQWMLKARNEAIDGPCLSASLIPYRPDPEWWSIGVLSEDGAAGKLRASWYDQKNRVLWLRWTRLITGIHSVPDRIPFEGATSGAPFPSAIVFHSSIARKPFKRSGLTAMFPR